MRRIALFEGLWKLVASLFALGGTMDPDGLSEGDLGGDMDPNG